jgi:pilus assembly protein CpaC
MKKIFLIIFLISAIFMILFFPTYAENELGQELKLYLGEVKIISLNNPTRIVIGNPNIANVANITKSEMTLSPKALGTTTLVYWDNFGEHSYTVKVLTEDMQEIKRRIDSLLAKLNLPDVYTQAQEDEGKVLLLGEVKTSQERERINTALGALKDKTIDLIVVKEEEAIVDIDVQVLELNKDATNTLGFSFPGSITFTETGSPALTATKWSTVFRVANLTRAAFTLTLDALVQQGKARVLSRPRVACQSGKEAELLVGGEKPILTTTVAATGATGTEVEYKEYGIKLKIKPIVTDVNRIKLALNVEVSEVGTAEILGRTDDPTAKAYPLTKRNISTELSLDDGQTLGIGGLIKQKAEEDIRKTPFLGDVPIIGMLFRKKTTTVGGGTGERGDAELFITLTPTIIMAKKEVGAEKKEAEEIVFSPIKKEVKPEIVSPTPEKALPEPVAMYSQLVQKRILNNLTYPSLAKEAGFQGALKLSLRISYQGELLDIQVKVSSGHRILDDNAVSAAKAIAAYPPFPSSIDKKELWIDIPIVYRLD